MYKVIIDGEEILVTSDDIKTLDNYQSSDGYHVLDDTKAYHVTPPKVGQDPKTGTIYVNEKRFRFDIMDQ